MAAGRNQNVRISIFRRVHNPLIYHKLTVNADDIAAADAIMSLTDEEARIDGTRHFLFKHGPPPLVFVGDSNVVHLKNDYKRKVFSEYEQEFLRKSYFVGVGGTTWWKCESILNGYGLSAEKFAKYGDQWDKFSRKGQKVAYLLACCGSNDADDLDVHLQNLKRNCDRDEEFNQQAMEDIDTWLEDLYPCALSAYTDWHYRVPEARLGLVQINPRPYWNNITLDFARRLHARILKGIKEDMDIKLRSFSARSLFTHPDYRDAPHGAQDEIIKGFLKSDSTHLNAKGNRIFARDLSIPLVNYWAKERSKLMKSDGQASSPI